MKLPNIDEVKTQGDARQLAIDWQTSWQDNQYSYGDLIFYQDYFRQLGNKFDLIEEFEENGII